VWNVFWCRWTNLELLARIHSSAFSYEGVLVGAVVLLLGAFDRGGDSLGLGDVWGLGGILMLVKRLEVFVGLVV